MVTFDRSYKVVSVYDETDQDDEAEFDSSQHLRDLAFWSGLSLLIGIFIGMAIVCGWKGLP